MAVTHATAESTTQVAPTAVVAEKPKLPEKLGGPTMGMVQRAATGAVPLPGGASGRARVMRAMQGGVGNTRSVVVLSRQATALSSERVQPDQNTAVQRSCSCGGEVGVDGECMTCRATREALQRHAAGPTEQDAVPASVSRALRSDGGHPIDRATRASMESAFGADFGDVRLHTDSQAATAARDISAKAFTSEQSIYFGAGQHRPDTAEGQKLLAHELTHTIQQRSGRSELQSGPRISQPGDPLEREAEIMASRIDQAGHTDVVPEQVGPLVRSRSTTSSNIQRAWYDVVAEGAGAVWEGVKWTGSKIASGADAAWTGLKWAGGKVWDETMRVGSAAWECAVQTGRTVTDILKLDTRSLIDLFGVPKLGDNSPIHTMDTILTLIQHACLRMIPGYSLLADAVGRLEGVSTFLRGAWKILQNPATILDAIRASLSVMIAEVPIRARELTRSAVIFSEPLNIHLDGTWRHLEPKLDELQHNWWEVLLETGRDLIWPWPGVGTDLQAIWNSLTQGVCDLRHLNLSGATDQILAAWRHANSVVGRLYGWFALAALLAGTSIGAIVGGPVGALAGAAAGAKVVLAVGKYLLVSTILAETASIGKAGVDLVFTEQTDDEREADYEQIASSGLVLAITGAMFSIGVLAARFARNLINRIAGRVWRMPALRRRDSKARGDIIEIRAALATRVTGILRGNAVKWLEVYRRNFPAIDILEGGRIVILERPHRAPLYQVHGGRIISVKSTGLTGPRAESQIRGWIDDLANFTSIRNVSVINPAGRTLMIAVQDPLDDALLAAVRNYAQGRVTIDLFTNLPPNHPSLVFPDAIPSVMGAAGVATSDRAGQPHEHMYDEPTGQ